MKSLTLITVCCLAFFVSLTATAQKTFTSNELKEIDQKVDSLMALYYQYSTFTSDLDNLSEEYVQGFAQLFPSNTTEIYNDIDYTKKLPKKISVAKYLDFVKKWYPGGFSVDLKILEKMPPRFYNDKYLLTIRTNKAINGLYSANNNQDWQRYKGEQLFTIEFDEQLSSFTIQSIDEKGGQDKCTYWKNIAKTFLGKNDCKLARGAYDSVLKFCPSDPEAIKGLKKCDSCLAANKKPLFLVLHLLPGVSAVSLTSSDKVNQITSNSAIGYQGGIGMELAVTKGKKGMLSVGLLLDLAIYNSEIMVNTIEGSVENMTDIDLDSYKLIYKINSLKETDKLTYFQVPLYARYDLSLSRVVSLYGKLGVKAGLTLSSSYTSTGTGDYKGQYEKYGYIILYGNELIDYGFGIYDQSVNSSNNNVNSINISGFAGIGVNLAISKNVEIYLGGEYTKGITDISKSGGSTYSITEGKDKINSLYGLSNASSQFFGAEIGIRIKVFKY